MTTTSPRRHGMTEQAADAAVDQACRLLRLPTVRAQFNEIADGVSREQMTYRAFLAELLLAECDDRARRRSERRIRAAGFPRDKSLRAFDFDANPNIEEATINTLARGDWIKKGVPLCLIGDSGTGKSHLLIALGTEAAMQGHRVEYTLATKLVNELVEAADEKQLTKTIARYGRVDLLCIDELGYMELDRRGAGATVPGPDRARGEELGRDRVQRFVLRLDENLHRPEALRRDRGPPHLRWSHYRNRHRLLPSRPHGPSRRRSSKVTSEFVDRTQFSTAILANFRAPPADHRAGADLPTICA